MNARRVPFALVVTLWVILFGPPGLSPAPGQARAGAPPPPAVIVTMDNQLKFSPAVITIKPGALVRWNNGSVFRHTVTLDPARAARTASVALPKGAKPFDSGYIDPKGSFEHRFPVAGHYRYFCIPHESTGMVGEIIVE